MAFILGVLETFFMFIFYNIIFKKNWKNNILIYALITLIYVFLSIEVLETINEYLEIFGFIVVSVIESKISNKEVALVFLELIVSNILLMVLGIGISVFRATSYGRNLNILFFIIILFVWLSICAILINYIINKFDINIELFFIKSRSKWYIIIDIICVYILFCFISENAHVSIGVSICLQFAFVGFIAIIIYAYIAIYRLFEEKEKMKIQVEYQEVIDELIDKFKSNEKEYKQSIDELVSIVNKRGDQHLKDEVNNYVNGIINEKNI